MLWVSTFLEQCPIFRKDVVKSRVKRLRKKMEKENRKFVPDHTTMSRLSRKGYLKTLELHLCTNGWQLLLLRRISLVAKRFTDFYSDLRFKYGAASRNSYSVIYYTSCYFKQFIICYDILNYVYFGRIHRIQISVMMISLRWNHEIFLKKKLKYV